MAKKKGPQQTIVVPHRMAADVRSWLLPFGREQTVHTRLSYKRAAVRTVTKEKGKAPVVTVDEVAEKDVRHAVVALSPVVVGDSWTLNCAIRQGIAMRKAAPDGRMVFGSKPEMRRRTKGLVDHAAMVDRRVLPLVSFGDRLYRGNRSARLVMTDAGGNEIVARALPVDPLPRKRKRESKKGKAYDGTGTWLRAAAPEGAELRDAMSSTIAVTALRLKLKGETRLIPLVRMRGKQGRLLAQVAWLASMGMLNVTFRIDDEAVHVTFDPTEVVEHPERMKPTAFVDGRAMGIDLNPGEIGAAIGDVCVRDGKKRFDLPVKIVEQMLCVPNLDRYASSEEATEAMAKIADLLIGLCRKRRCRLICVENLKNLRSGGMSRRLNHLLSRWCREKFLDLLRRRAALCGIEVVEAWAGYSTLIGNVEHDLPDACAAAAEMARRGLVRKEDLTSRMLPSYDEGYVPGRVKELVEACSRGLPPKGSGPTVRRKEGTWAANRASRERRVALLLQKAEHVDGWKQLYRIIRKSGVRARRPRPGGASASVAVASLGPSRHGIAYRVRDGTGRTSSPA